MNQNFVAASAGIQPHFNYSQRTKNSRDDLDESYLEKWAKHSQSNMEFLAEIKFKAMQNVNERIVPVENICKVFRFLLLLQYPPFHPEMVYFACMGERIAI